MDVNVQAVNKSMDGAYECGYRDGFEAAQYEMKKSVGTSSNKQSAPLLCGKCGDAAEYGYCAKCRSHMLAR